MEGSSRAESAVSILTEFFSLHPEVQFVRHQWVDFSGILRVRVLTKDRTLHLATSSQYVRVGNVSMKCLVDNSVSAGARAAEQQQLCPDWTSLSPVNFGRHKNNYASVMCFVLDAEVSVSHTAYMGSRCPRAVLYRVLAYAKQTHDVSFLVGFELEFCLFGTLEDGTPFPLESHPGHYAAAGIRTAKFPLIEECVEDLLAAGIDVLHFHAEGELGGYEIATGPLAPIPAVDALVLSQETIKNCVARHGHQVTFHPKPFLNRSSNGTHAHVSMHPTLGESHFLAGILQRLPSLCAFSMPSSESYARVNALAGEVGAWVAWGTENRSVPIRKIGEGHWELRCVDATCNMYLTVAAMLTAGLLGLGNQETTDLKDFSGPVADLDHSQRRELNIITSLPTDLKAALGLLREDYGGNIDLLMGAGIISEYLTIKEAEEAIMKDLSPRKRSALYLGQF